MRFSLFVFAALLSLPVLLSRCAQVAQPPGGKKDSLAPVLIRSVPLNRATQFAGQSVILEFDEYIKAENLQQKLLMTPQDSNTFIVKELPTGLRLNFSRPFKPNTTYTLSFADAIRDVTERNVAKNPKIVFSTGSFIDSLGIGGVVTSAETRLPLLGFAVGLFEPTDTLPINRKRPTYFARTDSNGIYRIENIKAGRYTVFGFQDADLNLVNNQPGERVAFQDSVLMLGRMSQDSVLNVDRGFADINLVAFRGTIKPRITRRERNDEVMGFEISGGVAAHSLKITGVASTTVARITPDTLISFQESPTMIRVFKQPDRLPSDTVYVMLSVQDSVGNTTDFKERVYFSPIKTRARDRKLLNAELNPAPNTAIDNSPVSLTMTFNKPIRTFNPALVSIFKSDSTKSVALDSATFRWSNNFARLTITKRISLADTMLLLFKKGAFVSIQNDTLPRQRIRYLINDPNGYGVILGKVNRPEKNFIVELLDERYDVVRSAYNTPNFTFARLRPARYRVRLVLDDNANHRRDVGNIQKRIQPETVIYYPGDKKGFVPVKQDFEIEIKF
jgi:hypothetical protein